MTSTKSNSTKLIQKLIIIVLAITPLFSLQESLALLLDSGKYVVNTSNVLTSVYIKGLKDLFFLLMIFTSFLMILKTFSMKRISALLLGIILVFILLPAFYYQDDILVYLSGVRWLMPFILLVFLIGHIDEKLLNKIGTILFYLFILHFFVQLAQLLFSYGHFGLNRFGLSSRNPGLFYIPSTAAVFAILVLFFSKFYMDNNLEKKIQLLIPISVFLTASGTGIGIYVIFMIIYYLKRNLLPFLPLFLILVGGILILSLDFLSGRSGLVAHSLGPRLEILIDVILNGTFLPEGFGYGTATAALISNKFDLSFAMITTDSWYASLFVNLGIINSLIIVMSQIIIFIMLTRSKDKEKLLFLTIYSLFALTTPIAESYPANLIFACLLAHYIQLRTTCSLKADDVKYKTLDQNQ